jgi:hypothetical protein
VLEIGVGLPLPIVASARRQIDLTTDDRLDALLLAGLIERDDSIERAVVGDREGGEMKLGGASGEVIYAAGAVKKAVLGMNVKMSETRAATRR